MPAKTAKQVKAKKAKRSRALQVRVGGKRNKTVWYRRWQLYSAILLVGIIGSALLILTHADTNAGCVATRSATGSTARLCVTLSSSNTVTAGLTYSGGQSTYRLASGTVNLYKCARSTYVCQLTTTSNTVKIPNTQQPNIATVTTPVAPNDPTQVYKSCMSFADNTDWSKTGICTVIVDFGSTTTSSQQNCGGQTLTKRDGSAWQCTFSDEFSGTSLDTRKWDAWNNVNYWPVPSTCYYNDPQHLAVNSGFLNLTVTRLSNPPTCATATGARVVPTYGAAVVNTKNKFSQTQGRFEARIKFAGGKGLHDDFWLYPENNYYPGHAEIDIAEPYGALSTQMNAAIHMTASDGVNHPYLKSCPLQNWDSTFHTYSLEWTATAINFSYDGVLCYSFTGWKPLSGYTAPAPFDQNFFVILQAAVDNGYYSPAPDASTVMPVTMQVDWVRVWK